MCVLGVGMYMYWWCGYVYVLLVGGMLCMLCSVCVIKINKNKTLFVVVVLFFMLFSQGGVSTRRKKKKKKVREGRLTKRE